ncbi:hypothetical protein A0H81_10607 [Grifola frondosa]|uniref:Uncharacterized protein n=1 Tax=Grifola frondosa TaxID=5627 RepID=A0A1C7LXI2_GRIFR|nr:hypothetical protein A0H81_10607 [Grifola frondosa]
MTALLSATTVKRTDEEVILLEPQAPEVVETTGEVEPLRQLHVAKQNEHELLAHLDRLKFFLTTATSRWSTDAAMSDGHVEHPNSAHPRSTDFSSQTKNTSPAFSGAASATSPAPTSSAPSSSALRPSVDPFLVPHDRLFLDVLECDLKREKMGFESTTVIMGEPAQSFTYGLNCSLYEQFSKEHRSVDGEGEGEAVVCRMD